MLFLIYMNFDGIGIFVNIISLVAFLAILIFLLPNFKILFYTILNTFDFKAKYIKGEFLTFSSLLSLLWVVFFSFYNNDIISYYFYNQLFEFWWVVLSIICLFIISMAARLLNNSVVEIKDSNKTLKLNYIPLYLTLIFVLLIIYIYLLIFISGIDNGYWSSSRPIFYAILILDIILLVWLFFKIFKLKKD